MNNDIIVFLCSWAPYAGCSPESLSTIAMWALCCLPGVWRKSLMLLPTRLHRFSTQLSTRMCEQQWMCKSSGMYDAKLSRPLSRILWCKCRVSCC